MPNNINYERLYNELDKKYQNRGEIIRQFSSEAVEKDAELLVLRAKVRGCWWWRTVSIALFVYGVIVTVG